MVGYVAAIAVGIVDFSPVADAGWFAVPVPGRFWFSFEPVAILTFTAIHITAAIESVGDISGITSAEGRTPTEDEVTGGLFVDGIGELDRRTVRRVPAPRLSLRTSASSTSPAL